MSSGRGASPSGSHALHFLKNETVVANIANMEAALISLKCRTPPLIRRSFGSTLPRRANGGPVTDRLLSPTTASHADGTPSVTPLVGQPLHFGVDGFHAHHPHGGAVGAPISADNHSTVPTVTELLYLWPPVLYSTVYCLQKTSLCCYCE